MSTTELSSATWRKSTRSNGQMNCVEVADLNNGQRAIRDSKNPTAPPLIIPATAWTTFTIALRTGDL